MRALILTALLAFPLAASALPVNDEIHYFRFERCDMLQMILIVTQNQAYPIRDMDSLTARQRTDVEMARGYAERQGNAYVVEMPSRDKCHRL